MNKKLKKTAHEIVYKSYKCPYCKRDLPNYSFLTKDKCVWCDLKYYLKKLDTKQAI